MPLTSADKAFVIIALEKKALARDVLEANEGEVLARLEKGEVVSLASHLVERSVLDDAKRVEIERVRARHGRACQVCTKTTFLLPGEAVGTKPCEHCGGKLKASAPAASAPAGAVKSPSTGRIAVSPGAPRATPASPQPASATPAAPPKPVSGRIAVSAGPSRSASSAIASPVPAPAPTPPPEENDPGAKARAERARKLRQAGAFGYEPMAPEPAKRIEPVAAPPAPQAALVPAAAPAPADPDPQGGAPPATPRFAIRGSPTFAPPDTSEATAPESRRTPIEEAIRIFTFPVRSRALVLVTVGAFVAGFFSFFWWGYAFLLLYFHAFQIKVCNEVTAGKEGVSDWPDVSEIIGLGWKLFLCEIACLLPAILILLIGTMLPSGRTQGDFDPHFTIGSDAHLRAGLHPKIVGANVANEILYDLDDNPVRIGDRKGRWLVLGLLAKDVGDDTGTATAMASMPKAGITGIYFPDAQIYDLDRLQRAVPGADVAALFIDPRLRLLPDYGLRDRERIPGRPQETQEQEEEGFERTKPVRIDDLPLPKNAHGRHTPREFAALYKTALRTHELVMPGAFANPLQPTPCVWIIDPQGKVCREFEGGADDQALWGALNDLQRGGSGGAGRRSLPGSSRGFGISGLLPVLLTLLAVLFAALYHPMAFLMTVVFNNGLVPFNYFAGVASIRGTSRDYFFNVAVLLLTSLASGIVSLVISVTIGLFAPELVRNFLMGFVSWWLLLYTFLVEAYALGRFYVKNKRTLGWLEPAPLAPILDANDWRPPGA